jgi:SAM-dependent methyltransferase
MTSGNAAQIAYWNDVASVSWTKFQTELDAIFAPLTEIALSAAAPSSGERVIDVGCGCGATVLELAGRVGPAGRVLGVDVSAPMAERARARIAERSLHNARIEVSDAAVHPFTPADTDLLFSRFGVMFFTDPTAAFSKLRKAMRPDGRLLFACWRPLADNPWFALPLQVTRGLLPPQPPADPIAPGPFAFASSDRVLGILRDAGWRDASTQRHDVPMRIAAPGDLDGGADFATRVGPLARLLAEADDSTRAKARQAVIDALGAHDSADGINLTGSIWLVSARA